MNGICPISKYILFVGKGVEHEAIQVTCGHLLFTNYWFGYWQILSYLHYRFAMK